MLPRVQCNQMVIDNGRFHLTLQGHHLPLFCQIQQLQQISQQFRRFIFIVRQSRLFQNLTSVQEICNVAFESQRQV